MLLALLGLVFVFTVTVYAFLGVVWVPTSRKVGRKMVELAELQGHEKVLDLGCGDGSLLLCAAEQPGVRCLGIDFNPVLCRVARLRAWMAGAGHRIRIERADFFGQELPAADVIMTYLFPEVQERLGKRFLKYYPSGTKVVSHAFRYPDLKLVKTVEVGSSKIHLYVVP